MARPKAGSVQTDKNNEKALANRIEKTKTVKTNYVLDLKVNSPSSLEYLRVDGLDSAPAMVRISKVKGLDVIAITDMFSGNFIDSLVSAAKGSPLIVIPGVSLRCRVGNCDDVVLSCLFPETTTSSDVASFLRTLRVPESASGNYSYTVEVPMDQVLHTLELFGGIAIPARIDKTPPRLSVLNELVSTYGFRAFDLAYAESAEIFKKRWPNLNFQLFSFSDAYALAQIGSRSARVKMPAPGFAGICQIMARERP